MPSRLAYLLQLCAVVMFVYALWTLVSKWSLSEIGQRLISLYVS